VPQDNGAWNIFVGNGQSLVLGSNSAEFITQPDPHDPSRLSVAFRSGSSTVDMSASVSGGSMGGLLDFRRQMLDPARNELGRIAIALSDVANAQHREGMDLQGDLGGDLFRVGGVEVLPNRGNTAGASALTATRTGAGALTGDDYLLSFDGSSWSARNAQTGAAVAVAGTGTSGSPLQFAGLSVVVGGRPSTELLALG
jgi:flagellar hook-associated protein 1 FlgK